MKTAIVTGGSRGTWIRGNGMAKGETRGNPPSHL